RRVHGFPCCCLHGCRRGGSEDGDRKRRSSRTCGSGGTARPSGTEGGPGRARPAGGARPERGFRSKGSRGTRLPRWVLPWRARHQPSRRADGDVDLLEGLNLSPGRVALWIAVFTWGFVCVLFIITCVLTLISIYF